MSRPWLPRARKSFVISLIGSWMAFSAVRADAGPQPIALGEVTTRVTRDGLDLPGAFRDAVVTELERVELHGAKKHERMVVSASLVRLDTETRAGRARTTCVVSATLRKAQGGALVAVLQGRARAEDSASQTPANELAALRAAVRSAVRGIPTAVRS